MRRSLFAGLGAAAALCLSPSAQALTLVNQSSEALTLASPVAGAAASLPAGQNFEFPASWGDARHVYATLVGADGTQACTSFHDRYGTAKIPRHAAAVVVAPDASCTLSSEIPEALPLPDPPSEPPSGGESPGETGPPAHDDPPTHADRGFPPRGNATWLYDATFPEGPQGPPHNRAGLYADAIREYNAATTEPHRIHQLFAYGGDLEMECLGGSDCSAEKMHVYYYPPTSQHPGRSFAETGSSGFASTHAYAEVGGDVTVIPVFDGRLDAGGYLQEFETLDDSQARTYADIFARTVCADPAIGGVQLDLEPFDIGDPAQKSFYDQLASNLAGQNAELEPVFGCVSSRHPRGRFFSVFTFANQITPELGEVFTRFGNGVVIVSLYDLGPGSATEASRPDDYRADAADEIARTVSNSRASSDVPFQFGIPAAASTKEFEAYRGVASGFRQVDYVAAALDALDASGVRENPAFFGTALWGWSRFMAWPPHSDGVFLPAQPSAEVLALLAERL